MFASMFILAMLNVSETGMLFMVPVLVFGSLKINELLIWPNIIRPKKWQSLKESLPKSRVVGYSIFLVLPVFIIIGVAVLAAQFA